MKILYILSRPLEINTSASIRNRATIMGLVELGHHVDLFTTQPDRNHSAYDASMTLDGVNVTYVELQGIQKIARVGRKLRFLAPLKRYVYEWLRKREVYDNLKGIVNFTDRIDLEREQYDYIISSSDPKSSHLFVETLLKEQRSSFSGKWIQIWGDPFLGDITLAAGSNMRKIRQEEQRLLQSADKVIYVSRLTLQQQKAQYPESSHKMQYLPIPYLKKLDLPVRSLKEATEIKLVYCGDYTASVRNIMPLYRGVSEMENVHLTICGNSDMQLKSNDHVTVMPRQPYAVVEELEREADILVHLSNSSGGQIPGKIYQYSATNKPILFVLDGDSDVIRQQFAVYDRYEFTENFEADICNGIREMIRMDTMQAAVSAFSKEVIAQEVIDMQGV